MVFNFFSFKRKPVLPEAAVTASPQQPAPMTFDEALAAQVAAKVAQVPAEVLGDVASEATGQMDTMKATREDVIAAYKIFLGRLPESMKVVEPRVGVTPFALLVDFLASKEFLDQAPKSQLVLAVAKKVLDAREQEAPPAA